MSDQEKWAVLDCGKYPSEKNCRICMMCPAEEADELVELAAMHAVKSHAADDNQELREEIRSLVEYEMR